MLNIKKTNPQMETVQLELDKELIKQLNLYLKVGKFHKNFDKSVNLNDIADVVFRNLISDENYIQKLKEYDKYMESKRKADRLRKAAKK